MFYLKNPIDCVMGKIMQLCILITNRRWYERRDKEPEI